MTGIGAKYLPSSVLSMSFWSLVIACWSVYRWICFLAGLSDLLGCLCCCSHHSCWGFELGKHLFLDTCISVYLIGVSVMVMPFAPGRKIILFNMWMLERPWRVDFGPLLQPILVYMSKVDGKFKFSPVSVNFLTEIAKVLFAVVMLLLQVCYILIFIIFWLLYLYSFFFPS